MQKTEGDRKVIEWMTLPPLFWVLFKSFFLNISFFFTFDCCYKFHTMDDTGSSSSLLLDFLNLVVIIQNQFF